MWGKDQGLVVKVNLNAGGGRIVVQNKGHTRENPKIGANPKSGLVRTQKRVEPGNPEITINKNARN